MRGLRSIVVPLLLVVTTGLAAEQPERSVSWLPERPEQGDALLIRVAAAPSASAMTGTFMGKDLVFFPWGEDEWRALGAIPVDASVKEHELLVIVESSAGRERRSLRVPVRSHGFSETALRVDPRYVSPPADEIERIASERRMIAGAFARSESERLWRPPLVRPAKGRRTSGFGVKRTFNGEVRSRHTGLDLDGAVGDPIAAMAAGRVVLAHHLYYAGKAVFIDHGHELFTVYFHMDEIDVAAGDEVEAGQRIGTIGATGRVTGPHLHLGVRISGRYVNPERLLDLELGSTPVASDEGAVQD